MKKDPRSLLLLLKKKKRRRSSKQESIPTQSLIHPKNPIFFQSNELPNSPNTIPKLLSKPLKQAQIKTFKHLFKTLNQKSL